MWKLDIAFLSVDVELWDQNPSFISYKHIVDNINVCNDAAERGVKLTTDFSGAAWREDHL